jgi:hypothetical protein
VVAAATGRSAERPNHLIPGRQVNIKLTRILQKDIIYIWYVVSPGFCKHYRLMHVTKVHKGNSNLGRLARINLAGIASDRPFVNPFSSFWMFPTRSDPMLEKLARPDLDRLLHRGLNRLSAESRRVAVLLELKIELLLHCWMWLCVAFGSLKLLALAALYPEAVAMADLPLLALPYLLIALAPIAGYRLATACFPAGRLLAQPGLRLARFGRWQNVPAFDAARATEYGPSGVIVSLIAGLLISIVLRSGEYFVAVPAIPLMAPVWARTIIQVMTLDMVVMGFLYSVCFRHGAAQRPLFPADDGADMGNRSDHAAGYRQHHGGYPRSADRSGPGTAAVCDRQPAKGADQRDVVAALPAGIAARESDLSATAFGCAVRGHLHRRWRWRVNSILFSSPLMGEGY